MPGRPRSNQYSQSKQRKAEQSLVDLADHDASAIIPVTDVAIVCQSAPHPPGQHAETDSPDDEDRGVENEVKLRIETDTQMEGDSTSQDSYRDPRNAHKLLTCVSDWKHLGGPTLNRPL